MNTFTEFFNPVNILTIALLTLITYPLALVAFRAIRDRALTSVRVYQWIPRRFGDSRWEYQRAARYMSGLSYRWPFMAMAPRWFQPEESRSRSLTVVSWKEFRDTDDYVVRRWFKDDEYYLLVRYPNWTDQLRLLAAILSLVAIIAAGLWWNFHPETMWSRVTATPAPTQIAAAPTRTPRPTATPAPEVEVTDSGNTLVVELDRDVPPSEFWRRINEALSASCDVCPSIPTIPIPDWVWDIVGDWEFTVVRLPEGMDGYIVAYQTPYGMAVRRVDDNFQQIGNPEALAETEATIAARDRRFGIGYDNDGWDLPINGYRGNTVLIVTELGDLAMIVESRGIVYNFRWWHIAVLIIVIIAGVVVYRRIY